MLTVVTALVVISILILAHELGHFLMAKKAGIRVEEFGIGYPPRLWGKKIGETIYSINALPFGGFVRLYGESLLEASKLKIKGRSFWSKSKKARTVVIVAGVLANFFLAVLVFSIVYSFSGIPTQTDQVTVLGVIPDSPAAEAGLQEEDIIFQVNHQIVNGLDDFTQTIDEKKGQLITIDFRRRDEALSLSLTPRENPPENQGPLGVVVSNVQMVFYPVWQMPFRGAIEGFKEAFGWTVLVLEGIKQMFINLITQGAVPKDIAGPIGILQIAGGVAQSGGLAVLQFMGILSVNLAVLNILPFPALDGGRLMFIFYEAVARRRPKPEFERWANTIGMAILLFLIILVSINDLGRLFKTSAFVSKIRSFWPL